MLIPYSIMDNYSTRDVAKKLGMHYITLQRYISSGKIPVPKIIKIGGSSVRAWSEEDVEKVRKILPTIKNGRKTRYKKTQSVKTKKK
ncbi:MAG: helix-turn-helix domain-containing protein [Acidobacteriia bacterium]|nr:helix-turn-helix domain-containing protein [Terriglobia bacterium]